MDLWCRSERDVDGDSDSGMATVIHVIPVSDVVHIDVVGFVPSARPVFRPRINETEPEAPVLESRVSVHDNYWGVANAKPVATAKMRTEAIIRNPVAPVPPPFAPATMFTLPIPRAVVLPNISLSAVLLVFVPLRLAHVLRPIPLLMMGLLPFWPVVICPLLFVVVLFAPLRRLISLAFVRVLLRRASVFLLMLIPLLVLGASVPSVLAAMLCVGESGCSQK